MQQHNFTTSKMNMTLLEKLGNKIRDKRKELGLSQEKLAEHADVHRTYMGSVERGEVNIAFENLAKISKALKTTVSELTEGLK